MLVLDIILWLLVAILLPPLGILVVESFAALLPVRRRAGVESAPRPRCAVLIPAHNEEAVIRRTLEAILPQLQETDQLVVVADNCSDRTAETARGLDPRITILERHDTTQRGKGYALDFGVRHLEKDPPEVVVIIDADCMTAAGTLDRIVREAAALGTPVQATYLMESPPGANFKDQISAFAFLFKNLVRPRGLARLGIPCLLTGTGMAFPWPLLRDAPLATGNLVEDMQLGIDLAIAGKPPRLSPEARVTGELPSGEKASLGQRTRWEHGHIQTMLTQTPRLFFAAIRQLRLDLLGMALEMSIPPLAMLMALWGLVFLFLVGAWMLGASLAPAVTWGCAGVAVVVAIFTAWFRFGRDRLPFRTLLASPFYVLWKIPIYLAFAVRRQKVWVRTPRDSAAAKGPS
jgi:cellulose synthase/poly-beta-1,6-N-acetylglucosamine synthase-like glycosyltransferase